MNLTQMMQALRARRGLFAGVVGGALLVALTLSLVLPATYVAETSVVVDSNIANPVTGAVLPALSLPGNLATQLDVIASQNVALKVVDRLNLAASPRARADFLSDTGGAGSIRTWLAGKLLRKLDVKPGKESSVIRIGFSSRDPQAAAATANAFAEGYIQTSLELKAEPARRQAAWFSQQLQGLRTSLEAGRARLSEYQRRENIVGTEDRLDIESARLAEISNGLVAAQSTMYNAQTRLRQMNQALERNQLEELPDIAGNVLLQTLKSELVQAEGQLAQVAEHYDRNHPQYLSAAAQVAALKSKLGAELAIARGSISQAAEIAQKQAAQLQRALDEQKSRILQLKRHHDELEVLNREVEDAQRNYDTAAQRAGEIRLESQLDQSSIAVLNAAVAPLKPKWPNPLLNLAAAIALGVTLGIGCVMNAELRDRRVRSVADLTDLAGLLVLAEVPPGSAETPRRANAGAKRRLTLDARWSDTQVHRI